MKTIVPTQSVASAGGIGNECPQGQPQRFELLCHLMAMAIRWG